MLAAKHTLAGASSLEIIDNCIYYKTFIMAQSNSTEVEFVEMSQNFVCRNFTFSQKYWIAYFAALHDELILVEESFLPISTTLDIQSDSSSSENV